MHFEGPEKKLEVYFSESSESLFNQPNSYWDKLVEACGAKILSKVTNDDLKAYLLSESSLFVWKDKITLITCGKTQLVNSAKMLIETFGLSKNNGSVAGLFFERKNEYFPVEQLTSTHDDIQLLQNLVPGECYRFGRQDDHHLYLYSTLNHLPSAPNDNTLEILLYGGNFQDLFVKNEENQNFVKEKLFSIFPEFTIDEYWFEPCGYSMNGIYKDQYITLHATPQGHENYISFEISKLPYSKVEPVVSHLVETLNPQSLDVIYFSQSPNENLALNKPSVKKLNIKQEYTSKLENGFYVSFQHFYETPGKAQPPFKIC